MHCGCKNNVGPAVSFSSSSCDSLSRILVKGKYFLQLLPLNWKVVFESVFCENVETKFKWRSRRVSDNFQKLLWRHFYGDKSCVICWVMRHIFDKLFKRWMNVYFGLFSDKHKSSQDVKEFAENLKVLSLLSNVYFEWLDGNLCTSANGMVDTYRNPSIRML